MKFIVVIIIFLYSCQFVRDIDVGDFFGKGVGYKYVKDLDYFVIQTEDTKLYKFNSKWSFSHNTTFLQYVEQAENVFLLRRIISKDSKGNVVMKFFLKNTSDKKLFFSWRLKDRYVLKRPEGQMDYFFPLDPNHKKSWKIIFNKNQNKNNYD